MAQFQKPTTVNQVWASTGIITTPENLKIANGWTVEIPPYQYFNWSQNRTDSFIAHINQAGIPVWDNTTEYQVNKSYAQGSDGNIYKCIKTHTNFDPVNALNSAYWVLAFDPNGAAATVQASLTALQNNYNTLAGLTNYVQARTNLSVFSKTEADARYAYKSGESTQVFSVATATQPSHAIPLSQLNSLLSQATTTAAGIARLATASEVDVGTSTNTIVTPEQALAYYLKKSRNLADVPDKAAARTNLGLTSTATTNLSDVLLKAGNLSGLTNITTARNNLGLGSMAIESSTDWLSKAGNLSGLASVSTARTNLGLGDSATKNVGNTAGTVCAGDDPRLNALATSRKVSAGNGLTGGGDLTEDRTISLGTPASITKTSANIATVGSHTHAIDVNSLAGTTTGTLAAGDDSRIVNAVPNTRRVVAGSGLNGGGTLNGNVTLTLGPALAISAGFTGNGDPAAHTHQLNVISYYGDSYGTFAAGNDSRIVNSVQKSTVVVGQQGLVGGGDLSVSRGIQMGTPSTLSAYTPNSAHDSTHTHAIDINSFFQNANFSVPGFMTIPGGFTMAWGTQNASDSGTRINFPVAINPLNVQVTIGNVTKASDLRGRSCGHGNMDVNGFTAWAVSTTESPTNIQIHWKVVGTRA